MVINNHNNSNKKNILLLVFSNIISIVIGFSSLLILLKIHPNYFQKTIMNINKSEKEVTVNENGIADAVEKIYDSVITVENIKNDDIYATGTGFLYKKIDNKYYIITNYHVVQNSEKIRIMFTNKETKIAKYEGGDKYADIALLSYETTDELKLAYLGDSTVARVGDTVFAIGTPLDSEVYSWTVTRGVLSGKNREVAVSISSGYNKDWIMQVLQTDTAINTGNSGGPLCNSNGEVIGVTNMKLVTTGVEGMGFAIPIEEASHYADAIINGEDISRPQIGISMIDASNSTIAKKYGYNSMKEGVIITDVIATSSAAKAGLQVGDLITQIEDIKIKNSAMLRYQLYKYKIGSTIKVKYIRNQTENTIKVALTSDSIN